MHERLVLYQFLYSLCLGQFAIDVVRVFKVLVSLQDSLLLSSSNLSRSSFGTKELPNSQQKIVIIQSIYL